MQEAIANPSHLPLEKVLGPCRQQKASDEMLLFIRAVCGAGLTLDSTASLMYLRAVLQDDIVNSRYVLATLSL